MKIHNTFALLVGLSLLLVNSIYAQAVIEGHVAITKKASADVLDKRYTTSGEASGMGAMTMAAPTAVVYLEGTFPMSKSTARAQMAQKNIQFVTSLLPIQVGTTVEFPNLDDTYHSVFSYSSTKRFDLGRYRKGEAQVPTELFDKAGVVVVHCDIHENMMAIILVLDTPHFVSTGTDGNYRLTGLPAGHYKLKAFLDASTTYEKDVDLKSGSTLHIDFP